MGIDFLDRLCPDPAPRDRSVAFLGM